jgi:hypothetical protein
MISITTLSMLVLLLSVSPSSAALSPNSLTKFNTAWAGYIVSSTKPGTTLGIQAMWNVPTFSSSCFGPYSHSYFQFDVRIAHISSDDAGSSLMSACLGFLPVYYIYLYFAGVKSVLPPAEAVHPGDKMETSATVTVATGAISVTITDFTVPWTFTTGPGIEAINTALPASADWLFYGTTTLLPMFATLKTSSDVAFIGGHHGTLGSFLSISSDKVIQDTMIDTANGHVLARPSAITKTSSAFSITFVQSS